MAADWELIMARNPTRAGRYLPTTVGSCHATLAFVQVGARRDAIRSCGRFGGRTLTVEPDLQGPAHPIRA